MSSTLVISELRATTHRDRRTTAEGPTDAYHLRSCAKTVPAVNTIALDGEAATTETQQRDKLRAMSANHHNGGR